MTLRAALFLAFALVVGAAKAEGSYAVMIQCTRESPIVFARCGDRSEACEDLMTIYAGDGQADRYCGPDNWRM